VADRELLVETGGHAQLGCEIKAENRDNGERRQDRNTELEYQILQNLNHGSPVFIAAIRGWFGISLCWRPAPSPREEAETGWRKSHLFLEECDTQTSAGPIHIIRLDTPSLSSAIPF
jgi:hypothetical protein